MKSRSAGFRSAFTMIEAFAVLLLISILISLLLPAVQSAREMARRVSCSSHLIQVSLAVHGYHHSFDQLPVQLSGTDGSPIPGQDNDRRLSLFVALLPYLSHSQVADLIRAPLTAQTTPPNDFVVGGMMMGNESFADDSAESDQLDIWVAGGPEPTQKRYPPWRFDLPPLRCPSDPGIGFPSMGRSNYVACLGDGMVAADSGPFREVDGKFIADATLAAQTKAAMRGMFVPRVVTRMSDVTDGLSQTIMLSEINTDLGDLDVRTTPAIAPQIRDNPAFATDSGMRDPDRPAYWPSSADRELMTIGQDQRRGFRWADGMPLYTGFNTILPPNREIVLVAQQDESVGIMTASSRHQGGVHVSFADASVRFVSDSIDAGNPRQPTVYQGSATPPGFASPYGLWGALGTRATSELVGQ